MYFDANLVALEPMSVNYNFDAVAIPHGNNLKSRGPHREPTNHPQYPVQPISSAAARSGHVPSYNKPEIERAQFTPPNTQNLAPQTTNNVHLDPFSPTQTPRRENDMEFSVAIGNHTTTFAESGQSSALSNSTTKSSSSSCGPLLCVILIILLLTGLGISFLWHVFSGDEAAPAFRDDHALAVIQQDFITTADSDSDSALTAKHWILLFETGTELQEYERHPEVGGIEGLLNLTSLIDFNICCATLTHRFVCMGGAAIGQATSWFTDAYLEQDSSSQDIYLVLRTNSKDMISVMCRMTITALG